MILRERTDQTVAFRVGIAAQTVTIESRNCGGHRGRRRVGALVGIEFYVLLILRLFARHIGVELANNVTPEFIHVHSSMFQNTI